VERFLAVPHEFVEVYRIAQPGVLLGDQNRHAGPVAACIELFTPFRSPVLQIPLSEDASNLLFSSE